VFTWKRINWTVGWEERKGLESSQSGKGWVAFGLRRPCCEVESGEISIGDRKMSMLSVLAKSASRVGDRYVRLPVVKSSIKR